MCTVKLPNAKLGEDSPRLYSAQHDVVGKTMPDFVFAVVISELARVVATQQERINELEEALTKRSRKTAGAKSQGPLGTGFAKPPSKPT